MHVSSLGLSGALLLAHALFLPAFWLAHETNYAPAAVGVYSLFGIGHPPHNDFLLTLVSPFIAAFLILTYYRRGRKWAWYVLLFGYLVLILPVTVDAMVARGIGTSYYSGPFEHPIFGTLGPFYNEASPAGVVLPWVLFVPGILLGAVVMFRQRAAVNQPERMNGPGD